MDFFYHIISTMGFTLPLCMGYTVLFGRGKILHFGPIGVALASAYGTFLTFGATNSFALALCGGILVSLSLSVVFAWLSFRLDPDCLGILSIAGHLILLAVVLNWQSVTNGALGITNIPRIWFMQSQGAFAFWISVVCIGWIVFFLWLERTSFMRQLSALSEQEWYGKALGINRIRVHLITFLIVGLCIGTDNFFYPQYLHLLYPTDYMYPVFISLMMMVVAGKPGSIWGAIIASVLLILLKEMIPFLPLPISVIGPIRLLLFGVILLAAVWYRRDNMFPKKRTI